MKQISECPSRVCGARACVFYRQSDQQSKTDSCSTTDNQHRDCIICVIIYVLYVLYISLFVNIHEKSIIT